MTPAVHHDLRGSILLWLLPLVLGATLITVLLSHRLSHYLAPLIREPHRNERDLALSALLLSEGFAKSTEGQSGCVVKEIIRSDLTYQGRFCFLAYKEPPLTSVVGLPPFIDFETLLADRTPCHGIRQDDILRTPGDFLLTAGSSLAPTWCGLASHPSGSLAFGANIFAAGPRELSAPTGPFTLVSTGYIDLGAISLLSPAVVIAAGDLHLGEVQGNGQHLVAISTTGRVVIDSWQNLAALSARAHYVEVFPAPSTLPISPLLTPTIDLFPLTLRTSMIHPPGP